MWDGLSAGSGGARKPEIRRRLPLILGLGQLASRIADGNIMLPRMSTNGIACYHVGVVQTRVYKK